MRTRKEGRRARYISLRGGHQQAACMLAALCFYVGTCLAHDSIKFIVACYAEIEHAGRSSGHLPDGFHVLLPGLVIDVW